MDWFTVDCRLSMSDRLHLRASLRRVTIRLMRRLSGRSSPFKRAEEFPVLIPSLESGWRRPGHQFFVGAGSVSVTPGRRRQRSLTAEFRRGVHRLRLSQTRPCSNPAKTTEVLGVTVVPAVVAGVSVDALIERSSEQMSIRFRYGTVDVLLESTDPSEDPISLLQSLEAPAPRTFPDVE